MTRRNSARRSSARRSSRQLRANEDFEDVTKSTVEDMRFSPSPLMRGLSPMAKVTPMGQRVLEKFSGMKLAAVSNPVLYDDPFRYAPKVEHKTLIRLVLAGRMRVLRIEGSLKDFEDLSGHHRVGGAQGFHYELRAAT